MIKSLVKKQSGFTAIELLAGIAVIGIIAAATTTTVTQVYSGSSLSNNEKTAINNVRNAGDWIIRDAQQARQSDSIIGEGALDETGQIVFYGYVYDPAYPNKKWHRTVYWLVVKNTVNGVKIYDLKRIEDSGTLLKGVWTTSESGLEVTVAQNITAVSRTIDATISPNIAFEVTITATVGVGTPKQVEESRTFEVLMRVRR